MQRSEAGNLLTRGQRAAHARFVPGTQCHSCGAPVAIGDVVSRDAECESCRRDLRSCRNCRHYDGRYHNACRETSADPVEDKGRRNFCEYFSFNPAPFAGSGGSTAREAQARSKLEALFGGGPSKSATADARAKLDALFRKPTSDDDEDA